MKPRACPAGATELSPGFQPWETSKSTVRPEGARDAGTRLRSHLLRRKSKSAQLGRAGHATIGPSNPTSALLGRSIWRPFRARRSLGERFPGLKPWAEFCSPSGAQTKASALGLWPTALSEQNHPIPYLRAMALQAADVLLVGRDVWFAKRHAFLKLRQCGRGNSERELPDALQVSNRG